MTLQVGLVGSDGIVLASDRQINNFEYGDPTRIQTSKFEYNDEVVCCWSGDRPAIYAANFIRDTQWSSASKREETLRECGNRGWRKFFGDTPLLERSRSMARTVLVAFPSDCTLWELDVFDYSTTLNIRDRTVAGDTQTTAKHFVNNYIHEQLPVDRLITVAAHVILMTGREDTAYVNGLQIAVIQKGRPPVFLPEEKIKDLYRISESIYKDISAKLFQQRFSFPA